VDDELGVRAVVMGSLTQLEDSVRINVQLIDGTDNSTLWGETYTRPRSAVYEMEEYLSKAIADALGIQLTGEDGEGLTQRYTQNPEAYQSYLKGRHHWNQRDKEGFERALNFFNEAIDQDPSYALAYAGLADTYSLLENYGYRLPGEAHPQARRAAERALQIDETLAEAHTSLGWIKAFHNWEWSSAEAEFKQAIDLNPSYVTAHHWYGVYLRVMGRLEESFRELEQAQRLDPLSLIVNTSIGHWYDANRQPDQAIEQYKKTLEIDPEYSPATYALVWAYWFNGMYEEAVEQSRKAASLGGRYVQLPTFLRHLASDNRGEALGLLGNWEELTQAERAEYYALLGEKDRAFEWLEKAYEARSSTLPVYVKDRPELDALRDDPRLQDLLLRMNLEP